MAPQVELMDIRAEGDNAWRQFHAFQSLSETDWSVPANLDALKSEMSAIRAAEWFGQEIPLELAGEKIYSDGGPVHKFVNPSNTKEVVAVMPEYTEEMQPRIVEAVRAANDAQEKWRMEGLEKRIEVVFHVGELLKQRQMNLTALGLIAAAKSYGEAEGDVLESRELNYRHMHLAKALAFHERLGPNSRHSFVGTELVPVGPYVTAGPCNFPNAIELTQNLCAMLMGSSVMAKPSMHAAAMGFLDYQIVKEALRMADINYEGVINYVPGGKEMMRAIVGCEGIAAMRFTGSTDAYYELLDAFGQMDRLSGSRLIHSGETGGNNGVYVDKDADLGHMVKLAMALCGNGGLKCSTPSYITVHEDIYDEFMDRFREAIENVTYGDVVEGADMGPLIAEVFIDRLEEAKAYFKSECRAEDLWEKPIDELENAHNYAPTLLRMPDNASREEIVKARNKEPFGPMTLIAKVKDADEAAMHINASRSKLTASLYTENADLAYEWIGKMHRWGVGITYWNDKCTGAPVEMGFGGLAASGQGDFDIVGSRASLNSGQVFCVV